MKKEMVLIVVMSSISMVNAMDLELARQKQNSTIPIMVQQQELCCRLGYAVPVCDKCYVRIVSANMLPVEKKPSSQPKQDNKLSASQELRRCP